MVIMGQLKNVVEQMQNNIIALDNKINNVGSAKIKLFLIKYFNKTCIKFKGYLMQMKFKLAYEKLKLLILGD